VSVFGEGGRIYTYGVGGGDDGEHSPGEEIKRLRANQHKRYFGTGSSVWWGVVDVQGGGAQQKCVRLGEYKLYWLQTM